MFIDTVTDIWDQSNVEDSIFNALYALNSESFLQDPVGRSYTFRDNLVAKTVGCYFPPKGRVFYTDCLDIKNDGLPKVCSISGFNGYFKFDNKKPTLSSFIIFPIKALPPDVKAVASNTYYKMIHWCFYEKGVPSFINDLAGWRSHFKKENMVVSVDYVGINQETDNVYPVFDRKRYISGVYQRNRSWIKNWFSICASAFQDARHLWNVDLYYPFSESINTWLRFGVHEEHIQSLFYSRDLPITSTGRKRPIQHWVSSHKRRLKKGTTVDVKRHLRGINRFELFGYNFIISSPERERKHPELDRREKLIDLSLTAPTTLGKVVNQ